MTVEEVERVVHTKPFKPYRLVLHSGEEIVVTQPRKSHVSGETVALVGESRLPAGEIRKDRFRIVSIAKLAKAEHL